MFRVEVLRRRADRLSGDVAIAVPVAWQAVGYLIFAGLVAALTFLSVASYSRVEVAGGTVVPDSGVATIVPSRSGVIAEVFVREGQEVEAGAPLAYVRAEEDSPDGPTAAMRVEDAISSQDASIDAQANASRMAAMAQQAQLATQRSGLISEIAELRSQAELQRELVASAEDGLDQMRSLAERGFITRRDLQVREDAALLRRQQLAQLNQTISARESALSEADRSSQQIAAQARAQAAGFEATRAEIAQRAANASGGRAYLLRAPVGGRVTALSARLGQPATSNGQLMSIVPEGSVLRAELAVPTSAIGFVRPGQVVRLAIDAFPYQRFGTIDARVLTVSQSAISRQTSNGGAAPVYPVVASLSQEQIEAFGETRPLVPGMTLTARIVTDRRTLIEWLFEPLFAVRNR